ncbi:lipocalin-like domain-containing protein [Fulvivirga sp. RKSG066]|uniref:lipocalin-like domain-containing protein n=1 Tax=Fulvivirga aurantia TaxID=2529383 RepID=UPI0012BD80DE|nr:lipocalin-like domain-containing protein [Fulvivirga aurantia]MTI22240.1 lipocalin-like domain-containing protein [Fulvivirga aurantia]
MSLLDNKITEEIIGTWELVSWTYNGPNGEVVDYFGTSPTGVLMYTESGYMSVHIAKENRKKFKKDGMYDGTSDEIVDAFKTYFAYFGTYEEEEPGTFVHTVLGGTFPNWLGNTERRFGRIEGDRLILSTPPIETGDQEIIFNVEWRKV